jgi:hypothetical protein
VSNFEDAVSLCVCVCVCVCVYARARARVCTCALTHTHTHTQTPDYGLGKQGDVFRFPVDANIQGVSKRALQL